MEADWIKAFLYGAGSAVSLPVGAAMGVWMRPPARVIAGVMAMGAGALLAALTLELVGPAMAKAGFYPLAAGVSFGCGAFVTLNAVLNNQGAFLRKAATLTQRARLRKRRKVEQVIARFSGVDIFRALPPAEVQAIVATVEEHFYAPGIPILHQGDPGDALYIVESGTVAIERSEGGGTHRIATLTAGQTFGEMALLTGEARNADAVALDTVRVWEIDRSDFDRLVRSSPALKQAVVELMQSRKAGEGIDPEKWREQALTHLDPAVLRPTALEIRQEVHQHGSSAGLAIWLGACLDGVGESLVIGATTIGAGVSLPLVGGVLLSNLPEAMSSAAVMDRQGTRFGRIFWMWTSLTLVTGIAAAVGNVLLAHALPWVFAFFEGAAAGGMLAMIAQTMLPEAFENGGGTAVGILTVAGFLAALFVRSLNGLPPH